MAKNSADERSIDVLNSSGFPFQLGLQREIELTAGEHGWQVAAREFPWRHPETGRSGFADLVIQHQSYIFTLLIECKRVREGKWLFLTPPGEPEKAGLSAFWTANNAGSDRAIWGWADFGFVPGSPEAAFCVFRTQDEKNPLIERIADEILHAVEAIGIEESNMKAKTARMFTDRRLYLPVIVTNAVVYAATFDPGKVSMETGLIDGGDCEIRAVPCIRFRKGLNTVYPNLGAGFTIGPSSNLLRSASDAKNRSILVINAGALAATLSQLRIPRNQDYAFGSLMEGMIARALR